MSVILYPLGFGSTSSTSTIEQYISGIVPQKANIGENVVITGSGFSDSGNILYVDGILATILSESSTSITFVVPNGVTITTIDLILTKNNGSSIYAPNGLTIVEKTIGYESVSSMPNSFFHFQVNPAYDSDKELYRNLLAESFNIYGVPLTYYVVSFDTSYDVLFGEDNNRKIVRKFPINAVYELPKEVDTYAKFGLENLDQIEMYVSKKHFTSASKYDTSGTTLYPPETETSAINVYPSYRPKPGDLLHSAYNDIYYEIVDVGEEDSMFLQAKHSWRFLTRVFKDEKLTLSATTSGAMTEISAVSNEDDIFEVNDFITNANETILYTCATGEANSNQPDINDGWF